MEKKLQQKHLTNCNFLIAQNLWQAHYQILLIIFLTMNKSVNIGNK